MSAAKAPPATVAAPARPTFGRAAIKRINELLGERDTVRSTLGALVFHEKDTVTVTIEHAGRRNAFGVSAELAEEIVDSVHSETALRAEHIDEQLADFGYADDAPDPAEPSLPLEPAP